MEFTDILLEQTHVYRLWMAPFAAKKLAPVLKHNDLSRVRRVLDVGCGPGTNTAYFRNTEYVGVDINPHYVTWAQRRYQREFVVADIRTYEFPAERKFDFVLMNSFLHHVNTEEAGRILAGVARALAPDGYVHILDLVLAEEPSPARWMAKHDRGKFARRLEEWRTLFGSIFDIHVFEPYAVPVFGVTISDMVYCKARAKR